jgi:hypothetical protein
VSSNLTAGIQNDMKTKPQRHNSEMTATQPNKPDETKLPKELPKNCQRQKRQTDNFIIWKGRKLRLQRQGNGVWRLRVRTADLKFDFCTGSPHLPLAKEIARTALVDGQCRPVVGKSQGSLEEVAGIYLSTPKRVCTEAAKSNVGRLRKIVEEVLGKTLSEVKAASFSPQVWSDYHRLKRGPGYDYAKRVRENIAINAAVRAARSVLIRRMRPFYVAAGIHLRNDVDVVTWLPEPTLIRDAFDDGAMLRAWHELPREDVAKWLGIGLARFAGLRRDEISFCQRDWVIEVNGTVKIELCDRPEIGYQTKTGESYRAMVINPELGAVLLALPAGPIVQPATTDRRRWLERELQGWLRPFTKARKPLHRLRGLYADDVARLTQVAVEARLEGVRAAADNLGHTTTRTAQRHYLSVVQ